MVQLLIVLLIPPAVGLITYLLIRLPWKRGNLAIAMGPPRRRNPPGFSIFSAAEKRLPDIEPKKMRNSRGRAIGLLLFGIVGGFAFGWYFF
jgi:hypothetical protein